MTSHQKNILEGILKYCFVILVDRNLNEID